MAPFINRLHWLAPLVLAAIAFAMRSSGQAEVFADGGVSPIGEEAWYHLRRQVYAFTRFPDLLSFDPFLRFASGTPAPWAPGFDALIGWLAAGAGAGARIAAARSIGAWAPVVCGALSVVALFAVLRPRFGSLAAALGAGSLAIVPVHVVAGQVGYVNHRVAGLLLALVALWAVGRLLRAETVTAAGSMSDRAGIVLAFGAGIASAFALWVSMTALLPLLVMLVVLFSHALTRETAADSRATMLRVFVVCLVVFASLMIYAAGVSAPGVDAFSVRHPSQLHVAVFGGAALLSLGCVLAWRARLGSTLGGRAVLLVGSGVVLAAVALFSVPGLWEAAKLFPASWVGDPSLHAAQREPALGASSGLSVLAGQITALGVALPLLVVLALALEWSRDDRFELTALCATAAALAVGAWLAPGGFAAAGVAVSLAIGCAAGAVLRRLNAVAPRVALALVLAATAMPATLAATSSATRPAGVQLAGASIDEPVVTNVLEWIQHHGRDGGRWFDDRARPKHSVLAPWELGHRLLFKARRAPVIDGFYPTLAPGRREIVERLYREPAFHSVRDLQRLETQYVLVPDVDGFAREGARPDGTLSSLITYDGGEPPAPVGGDPFAISFLRLVYEHGERSRGGALRVYEHVNGARVVGSSRPERLVRFSLRLRSTTGREFTYRVTTRSDPYWGSWEVRLPYSTLPTKRERFVEPLGSWQIECDGETQTVDVQDWKVRDGGQVNAPGLCY